MKETYMIGPDYKPPIGAWNNGTLPTVATLATLRAEQAQADKRDPVLTALQRDIDIFNAIIDGFARTGSSTTFESSPTASPAAATVATSSNASNFNAQLGRVYLHKPLIAEPDDEAQQLLNTASRSFDFLTHDDAIAAACPGHTAISLSILLYFTSDPTQVPPEHLALLNDGLSGPDNKYDGYFHYHVKPRTPALQAALAKINGHAQTALTSTDLPTINQELKLILDELKPWSSARLQADELHQLTQPLLMAFDAIAAKPFGVEIPNLLTPNSALMDFERQIREFRYKGAAIRKFVTDECNKIAMRLSPHPFPDTVDRLLNHVQTYPS